MVAPRSTVAAARRGHLVAAAVLHGCHVLWWRQGIAGAAAACWACILGRQPAGGRAVRPQPPPQQTIAPREGGRVGRCQSSSLGSRMWVIIEPAAPSAGLFIHHTYVHTQAHTRARTQTHTRTHTHTHTCTLLDCADSAPLVDNHPPLPTTPTTPPHLPAWRHHQLEQRQRRRAGWGRAWGRGGVGRDGGAHVEYCPWSGFAQSLSICGVTSSRT